MNDFSFDFISRRPARKVLRREIVYDYERALEFRKGRFTGVLGPGRYWRTRSRKLRRVDMRLRTAVVPGQELVCSDGVTVKISLVADFRVTDPERAVREVE